MMQRASGRDHAGEYKDLFYPAGTIANPHAVWQMGLFSIERLFSCGG